MPQYKEYQEIKNNVDHQVVIDENCPIANKAEKSTNNSVLMTGILFLVILGLLGGFLLNATSIDFEGTQNDIRACTYNECHRAGCDISSDPYLCVDQLTAYYGCSSEPWTGQSCADSCSLENCDDAEPADDQDSCRGISCGEDRCTSTYQKCGSDAPYQCVSGSAAMGCSDNEFDWMIVSDSTCSDCCDTTAC